jgi:1,4-alpha-glucan branching enzyme
MSAEIDPGAIVSLLNGDHGTPFDLLGSHQVDDKQISLRAFCPNAKTMIAVTKARSAKGRGKQYEMNRLHDAGFFEVTVAGKRDDVVYHYEVTYNDGHTDTCVDPYAFGPQLTDYEEHLWSEGRFRQSYERFGAHLREIDGVKGTHFVVWAPNADRVSVLGGFNDWDARVHPMLSHVDSGIWELFIPGVEVGATYKYEIRSQVNRYRTEKFDPYGFGSEMRPRTASVVTDIDEYIWDDEAWMKTRSEGDVLNKPMSIYEVHLGSWKRGEDNNWLTYRELADDLVSYVKEMGYTHIELMPVAEHPLDMSWGYQVTGYFAPTSRFGTPQGFMYFVDQCHQYDIGVILDWVPAHFPKDGFALSYFDGTHLYEHADPRQGEHPDWGTYIFNYGRDEVRNFLISNALFWLDKYHIDGLRVDAVSSMLYLDYGRKDGEWIPNDYGGNENIQAMRFLQEANAVISEEYPGVVTIAEESTSWGLVSRPTYLGGLGFTFKWDMGWMHDTLKYLQVDPVYRRYHHNQITFSIMYAFSENFVLSLSHDEVVHGKGSLIGKMPGDWWQQFASLRTLFGYQYTHPGKKLNFMGAEFGQFAEWSETRSLDWHLVENYEMHQMMLRWVRDLNHLYKNEPALYELDTSSDGFQWIEPNGADQSVYSYIRYAKDLDDHLVVVFNFTPVPRHHYRIGVPRWGYYKEMLNSDAEVYGGGNVGNRGGVDTEAMGCHGHGQSLVVDVPPLGLVVFKWQKS